MFNPPKEGLIKLNPQKVIDISTINQSLPSWSSLYLAIQVRLRPCLRHQRSRHCSYRHRSDVTVNRYVMVNACHDWMMQGVPLGNHQDSWASSSSKDVGNRWNGFFSWHSPAKMLLKHQYWKATSDIYIFLYIYFSHISLHIFTCMFTCIFTCIFTYIC